ncbi:hypothetical protein LEN26_013643 [Aphanomyces euteiches]|nr:hypothetical protein LEN26_013643 [Aphanomyces euteiches]KAH9124640.1 hypothetical protein AeMF1_004658 [Aphanomyces euteiches]KAH9181987.1 hypothetical protein AeNC1_016037 [Aphanomyces euteiches]
MGQRSRVQDTNIRNASTSQLPPALNSRSINSAVDAILDLHERRQAKRRRYSSLLPQDDDIDVDSHSPILDEFVRTRSISIVADLTNFSLAEFGILWSEIRQYIQRHWNVGPGCKNKTTPKDMLFMVLTFLKHGGSWDVIAALFKLKSSTFSKSITGFIRTIHPHLMQRFVTAVAEKWSMLRLVTTGHQFQNFPHARYAVDCTFQQTHIPLGSFGSKKSYFSKKHGLYGVKIEVSVLPNGFAIGVTPCAKGSVADIAILSRMRISIVRNLPSKMTSQTFVMTARLLKIFLINGLFWPTKVTRGSILSMEHEQLNADIATDRVIVENYFGRLKTLWSVANDIYSWKRENYDMFIQNASL